MIEILPMKRMFYIVSAALLCVGVMCSCAREIVMDAREKPLVAVECVLVDAPVQTLKLMLSKGASQGYAPVVGDADVLLINLTEKSEAGRFERQDSITWTLDYEAVPEHSYRLEIKVPDYELIWAEQRMPVKNDIVSRLGGASDWSTYGYQNLWGSFFMPTGMAWSSEYPTWIRAMNYDPETGKREIAEHICTDFPYVDNFNLTGGTYEPPTCMKYDSVSAHDSVKAYLYDNLRGQPLHRRYLRLDPSLDGYEFDDHALSIGGSFTGKYWGADVITSHYVDRPPKDDEGVVIASIVSADYDRYLREAIYQQLLSESGNMSTIYIQDNIFTNINGGVGILGAKSEKILEWISFYQFRFPDSPF